MSSSSSAAKAAAKAARIAYERTRVMESVRPAFVDLFKRTANDMVSSNTLSKSQCIVHQIARSLAKAMGINEDTVKVKDLHNNWKSYEFTHSVETPMPILTTVKGMPKDPAVNTTTVFIVTAKSAFIHFSYSKINEDGTHMGGEETVLQVRRPHPTPADDN